MTSILPGSQAGTADDGPDDGPDASLDASPDASPDASAATPLLAPRDGVPPVVETGEALAEVVARFAAGTGPVAVDAERASGYRYSQRAYLVQLRRQGSGTALVDPIACPDLSSLSEALDGVEWVLHAANQDLACLAEVGMVPSSVFDTELGGRLAGFDRVGLGAMVENVLGLRLEKGHSAADWSTRPLPEAWLVYAALDVEVLVELRDAIEAELASQGKLDWAREEFEAVRLAPPAPPRVDPWRRTSGMHRLRTRRQLAQVRALWEVRDAMARRRDTAPGRILPDAAIVGAVAAAPASPAELVSLPVFGGRATRRHADTWFTALAEAAALPDGELPQPLPPGDGPPAPNRWAERDPVAAKRLARTRAVVTALAEQHTMPPENLLQPDAVRRLAWSPPDPVDADTVEQALRAAGARSWQVGLTADALAEVLPDPAPTTGARERDDEDRTPPARVAAAAAPAAGAQQAEAAPAPPPAHMPVRPATAPPPFSDLGGPHDPQGAHAADLDEHDLDALDPDADGHGDRPTP